MSVLLLTNPYASQAQQPAPSNAQGPMALIYGAAGAETAQAVTPTTNSSKSERGGSSTSYDGRGAGAGGAAARLPLGGDPTPQRPVDATPGSIVAAQAESERATSVEEPAEIVDMAEKTRQRAQEMPLPLPTLPILMED